MCYVHIITIIITRLLQDFVFKRAESNLLFFDLDQKPKQN